MLLKKNASSNFPSKANLKTHHFAMNCFNLYLLNRQGTQHRQVTVLFRLKKLDCFGFVGKLKLKMKQLFFLEPTDDGFL